MTNRLQRPRPARLGTRGLTALGSLVVALTFPKAVQADVVDYGVYTVSIGGMAVGVESFSFDVYRDTIVVDAVVRHLIETRDGRDSLIKSARLMVHTFDMGLLSYKSHEKIAHNLRTRGLIMADTQYTATWEINGVGEAMVFDRPPGRLYVRDPEVYVLFDLLCRDLNEKEFSSRPIQLLVLGARDTTIEAKATRLPPEKIRWGHKAVEARKLSIHDGRREIFLWGDSAGRMLRLEQPATGLRVERKPPPVKARSSQSG